MTYSEAVAQLPAGSKWSSSFGNPGEGGYVEYHRDPQNMVHIVSNGNWMAFAPFEWTVTRLEPMPKPAAPFVDVSTISEYGLTQKLSNAIRCF